MLRTILRPYPSYCLYLLFLNSAGYWRSHTRRERNLFGFLVSWRAKEWLTKTVRGWWKVTYPVDNAGRTGIPIFSNLFLIIKKVHIFIFLYARFTNIFLQLTFTVCLCDIWIVHCEYLGIVMEGAWSQAWCNWSVHRTIGAVWRNCWHDFQVFWLLHRILKTVEFWSIYNRQWDIWRRN